MKPNDPIKDLLENAFGKGKGNYIRRLNQFNIKNIEQFYGAVNPYLPKMSDRTLQKKGIKLTSYRNAKKRASSPQRNLKKIRQLLKVNTEDARKVLDSLKKVKMPMRMSNKNKSVLSMGYRKPKIRKRSNYWQRLKKRKNYPDSYIIQAYHKMGEVFDQGYRGTCVANAATSLIDYLTNDRTSRQFLYHQCKMIDGIKDSEGTYMNIPMEIMTKEELVDFGTVLEKRWKYNPNSESTTHQGPPPEKCFDTSRYYGVEAVYTRKTSIVNDIKTLLYESNTPVTCGLELYESFVNPSTERTGWVTMPLEDEYFIGGHAMLVVGWYDKEKLFLVRNSWDTTWASENPKGFAGHALIPYKYFEYYCDEAVTLIECDKIDLTIQEEDRLYNKGTQIVAKGKRAAATKRLQKKKGRKKTIKKKTRKKRKKKFLWFK